MPSEKSFFQFLEQWLQDLPQISAKECFANPDQVAVCSVDLINGFCTIGPLASPRVQAIVEPVAQLLTDAWKAGVRAILFSQDTHEPDAVEFADFAPHCIRGTQEAETAPELKALPFFNQIEVVPKNSIASGINTSLERWIQKRPSLQTFIVVGDCTDLCVYQLAMYLKLDANARQLKRRVIVPAECVQTYDLPVPIAQNLGVLPHPGDLCHDLALYHLALNGVEVVRRIVS